MISKKYKNSVYVKVNYNNSDDPRSKGDAIVRALKKLDNKLQDENWRFDVERQRFHLNAKERRILKRRLAERKDSRNNENSNAYSNI